MLDRIVSFAIVVLFCTIVASIARAVPPEFGAAAGVLLFGAFVIFVVLGWPSDMSDWSVIHDGSDDERQAVYAIPSSRVTTEDLLLNEGLTKSEAKKLVAEYHAHGSPLRQRAPLRRQGV